MSEEMNPITDQSDAPTSACRKQRSSAGEGAGGGSFSFPGTSSSLSPSSSEDFEFGLCLTLDSPSGGGDGDDFNRSSPADHLFYNGRLLPHSFPFHAPPQRPSAARGTATSPGGAPSRTSSVGSKDSLLSSRSNSTSSRSSSCSSARTSAAGSDGCERRVFLYGRQGSKSSAGSASAGKAVSAQVYGSSRRWQFMAPGPDLRRNTSRRRNTVTEVAEQGRGSSKKKKKKKKKRGMVRRSRRFGRRLFRWLVSACRECHAIEPSKKDSNILRKNVN